MSENVSEDALGISELGSSNRSSVHVPPLTGVPPPLLDGALPGLGAPHAASSRSSPAKKEKAIMRDRGLGLLSIVSSSRKITIRERNWLIRTFDAATNED